MPMILFCFKPEGNLKANYSMKSIKPLILKTYKAAVELRRATDRQVKAALGLLASELEAQNALLLKANARDLERQDPDHPPDERVFLDRQGQHATLSNIREES